ncbi:hypothetical protein CTI12_AA004380 [Artemisia annua]|uniref:Ubiquitin-like domain-containing protein n=1 Tax=Artemisia annua TaxID=35608 RepID=A0A2U1QJJ3_ARTAN|nr:hypothetical protein CTI12_AA004380 [Artemisia annua]
MEEIIINIICSNKDMYSVCSSVGSKVVDFKDLLAQISCISSYKHMLIYRGMTLEDHRTLGSYGLQESHTIHMKVVPNPRFILTETTPLSDTTTGGPGLDRLYPAISMIMQSLLSNTQFMEQIIDQNPQLHDYIPQLTEMMQNPEVVRRLTSPHMMQEQETEKGLAEQLEEVEKDRDQWLSVSSAQARKIQALEEQLAERSRVIEKLEAENKQLVAEVAQSEVIRQNVVKELLPAACRRLFSSVEYKKSLGRVYSLSFTAGWLGGVGIQRKQEDLEKILAGTKKLNMEAPAIWKAEYKKLFQAEYPYIQKLAESFCLPLGDLMNLQPAEPIPPEKAAPSKDAQTTSPPANQSLTIPQVDNPSDHGDNVNEQV